MRRILHFVLSKIWKWLKLPPLQGQQPDEDSPETTETK